MITALIHKLLKEACTKRGLHYWFFLVDLHRDVSKMDWRSREVVVEVYGLSILTSADAISRVVGLDSRKVEGIIYKTRAKRLAPA